MRKKKTYFDFTRLAAKPTLQTHLYFKIDGERIEGETFPRLEWLLFSYLITLKTKRKSAEICQLSSYPLTGAEQAEKKCVVCSSSCQGTGVELKDLEGPSQAKPFYDFLFTRINSQTLSQ